jgi:amino acid adenylation domain-containing protein
MNIQDIEDMYELSPAQHGMLFHSLYSANSKDYFVQIAYGLPQVNVRSFGSAWQKVVERHPALRTAFVWEDLDKPIQVVYRSIEVPLSIEDWRGSSAYERKHRLETFLEADRSRSFVLSKAPLMRLTLIRLDDHKCYFVWSNHHLIMDGWSRALLVREVFTFYDAFCRSEEREIEGVRPYGEYIRWLQRQDMGKAEQYWRKQLGGVKEPTRLGIDKQGAGKRERGYGEQEVRLSEKVTAELVKVCRKQQVTMNTIVQGAWAIVLSRYSGREEVVYGTTVSGRPAEMEGVEGMVGLFINTLPVRVRVEGEEEVGEWLRRIQRQQVEMREYEYSPLVEIQKWSEIERGQALFESILVFENYPGEPSLGKRGDNLEEKRQASIRRVQGFDRTNYPLTVVIGAGSELAFRVAYSRGHYDSASIERLLDHYLRLLRAIAEDSQKRLRELSMLSPSEVNQILLEWNDTDTDYPRYASVHQLFELQARERADSIAVVSGSEQVTYAELNRRASNLAHLLTSLELGVESLVGLFLSRPPDVILGMLAVLKAGCAYVPIDPSYPRDRIALMLEDASVRAVLTEEALIGDLPACDVRRICLDRDCELIAAQKESDQSVAVTSSNLAYVMYTSGSTGKPKGVAVPHQAIVRLVVNTGYISLDHSRRIAQVSNFSFDAATFEIWGALLHGAQIVAISKDVLLAPQSLFKELREHGIDTIFLTSGLFNQISLEAPDAFSRMKSLMFGGDVVNPAGIREIMKNGPPHHFINGYGPTESTTFAVCHVTQSIPEDAVSIPIGRAISNTKIYILDGCYQPVPVGVSGTLYIGGDGLARGYVNRPDLTAEKFLPNPFSDEAGSRFYTTGDLACYLPDGSIEFLGRRDNQIKLRGFRIEIVEIELTLCEHPDVQQAVVLARQEGEFNKRLVAYIVLEQAQELAETDLSRFLSERLPDYMVPSAYVVLESLPLTPNGKVDYASLPEPGHTNLQKARPFVGPRDMLEVELVRLWERVFGLDSIGVTHDFFELGGHSFIALQLMSQILRQFGQNIPISTLFRAMTIEQLAVIMRQHHNASTSNSCLVPIQASGRKRAFFCVHPFGGNVLCYYPLAKHLGLDQPFYGFEAPGIHGDREPFNNFENMAAHYIQLMEEVQPHGPYLLGGWSLGGVVALEMAQQLERQGEKVDLLAVFDARLNESPKKLDGPDRNGNQTDYAELLVGAFSMDIPITVEQLREFDAERQLLFTIEMLKKVSIIPPDFGLEQARPWIKALQKNEWAYLKYNAQPYDGEISLFRASQQIIDISSDPTKGWGRIGRGGLHIREIPGDHKTMMIGDENVQVLANHLRACIAGLEAVA